MAVQQAHYETLLAEYSNSLAAIALLKQYRPYLEMIPSMRRSDESVITIPLPTIRLRQPTQTANQGGDSPSAAVIQVTSLPCDIAILMCDPEWKIKTGVEIFVFIHRPQEDFSDFLGRWRRTQVLLSHTYEWMMPRRYRHIISDGANDIHPLFVVFPETVERIRRGLKGACLPFVTQSLQLQESEQAESRSSEELGVD
ncbi:hypothetical protein DO97_21285 [Neosynechococcus sphagnicola sy1]|uniref:Uncharacterized protein n=1 Tax=Neosynechococcus sphagnicola sy1 TaxID=1497020 RepID=A0A098TLZ9_9CYAN|nr:hypothetical protein [Neosynechococcus sphagnicola]KGF73340.1 hypothetical protein DO97_21285 [Neosynechococcus sphagnicola sy1]